jgi:hypothetical protein
MAAIYGIFCFYTNKVYVGCTKYKLAKRMREHRCLLKKGTHASKSLQADWNKFEYGFFIDTLEELQEPASVSQKRERELFWMRHYEKDGCLYNENLSSFQGPPGSLAKAVAASHLKPGNRWTPEANEKRRQALLGRKHSFGWKISATKQAKKQQAMR